MRNIWKRCNKYQVQIERTIDGKRIRYIKSFDSLEEAEKARDEYINANPMKKPDMRKKMHITRKPLKIGIGVDRADRAILWLDEISDNDPLLSEAMDKVIKYCNERKTPNK